MSPVKLTTIGRKKISKINYRHCLGYDKWLRMYCGMATDLIRYKNNIITLNILNNESKFPSNFDLAYKLVKTWKNNNEQLCDARGYVVYFYKAKSAGFNTTPDEINKNPEAVDKKIKDMFWSYKKVNQQLVGIYSGILYVDKYE